MSEKFLHYPEVGAPIEHVSGEGMTQDVREYPSLDPCLFGVLLDEILYSSLGDPLPVAIDE
ncbi:MAG: hypothetical protein DDT26_01194 [Dehalococcoidia bacterium]|nr:hypothetical protein [Chloroflexota bacterium]